MRAAAGSCPAESLERSGRLPFERAPRWLPWAILALLLLGASLLVFWAGRETTFRGDDWDLLLYRGGFNWDVFLAPHNEHLSALMVVAYKAIPALFGPHYDLFRLVLLALDVCVAVLFFIFARERVGDWIALLASAPLLLLGGGSDNLLWPTQIGVVGSLASGIGVLILLDRPSRLARAAACAALTASIWFSSDGLFFLVCAGIWLLLSRDRWRDLWILAVPAITYVAWYSGYGSSEFTAANLDATPRFVLDSAAGGVSALTGISPATPHARSLGVLGGAIALALLGAFMAKVRPRLTSRLVAITTLPVLSWVIIALGRADGGDPFASRYAYAGGVFILMAIFEVARGDYLPHLFRGWRYVALALAVCASTSLSTRHLLENADYWRAISQSIYGRTAAIDLSRRTIQPNLVLEPLPEMAHMTPGWYLNAERKFGASPAGSPDIGELDEQGRSAADQVLAAGAPAQFVAPPSGSGPTGKPPLLDPESSPAMRSGSCLVAKRSGQKASLEIAVPASGILILPPPGAPARVMLRRYASGYRNASSRRVDRPTLLAIAGDRSHLPWHAKVSSAGAVSVCGAEADRRLRRGPVRPADGDQHCTPMSFGEDECRFRRY